MINQQALLLFSLQLYTEIACTLNLLKVDQEIGQLNFILAK